MPVEQQQRLGSACVTAEVEVQPSASYLGRLAFKLAVEVIDTMRFPDAGAIAGIAIH